MHLFDTSINRKFAYIFCISFCRSLSITKVLKFRFSLAYFTKKFVNVCEEVHLIKLSHIGCLGPSDKTSSKNFGNLLPFVITTLLWEPFRGGSLISLTINQICNLFYFKLRSDSLFFSRLILLTTDDINCGLIFFLILIPFVSKFPMKFLRLFSSQLISYFRSFIWKLLTACSEKNFQRLFRKFFKSTNALF